MEPVTFSARNCNPPPLAARPRLQFEIPRIRLDDPVRVHQSGARGTKAICNPSGRPRDREVYRIAAIRRHAEDNNRSGFAAGTQAGGLSAALAMVREAPDGRLYDDSVFGDEANRPSLARSLVGARRSRSINRSSPANGATGAP